MGAEASTNSATPNANANSGAASASAAVDIHKLADKVYRLLQQELRLERARGHPLPRRRR
jgi:hypothetical protein